MTAETKNNKFYEHRAFWVISIIALVVISLWILIYLNKDLWQLFTDQEALRHRIISFGNLAPAFIIIYYIFQILAAPLPGQTIDLVNGYIYGPFKGALISLIGLFLGSVIAVSLARIFGRPLLRHFLSDYKLKKYRSWINRRSLFFFFILFLIPGLPDDLLCFAAGLTRIPLWQLILVILLGRTPSIITSVIFGATGQSLNPMQFTLVILGAAVLVYLLIKFLPKSKRLKKYLKKHV
ncbi:MAG: TVP38/TMEM64 family protein [Patescibacteria group bacterium]|nr:TVP38/TMEM64 family protein [Patescibacteria group bacterium]